MDATLRVLEIQGLITQAKADAKNRGHVLRPFMVCHADSVSIAKSTCSRCGCTVQATVNDTKADNWGSIYTLPCRRPAA